MSIRIEVTINDGEPVVGGFTEEFYGIAATVSAANYPDRGLGIGVNMGGMVRDTKLNINWLNENLKAGDEIRIRILENAPISEPQKKTPYK